MQGGENRSPLFIAQLVVGKENKRGMRRRCRRSLGEWRAAVQRCSEEHHAGKNCTEPESTTRCKRAWGSRLNVHRCILALAERTRYPELARNSHLFRTFWSTSSAVLSACSGYSRSARIVIYLTSCCESAFKFYICPIDCYDIFHLNWRCHNGSSPTTNLSHTC